MAGRIKDVSEQAQETAQVARKSLETANQKMQSGQWYGCTTAARAGLDALKAM